MKVLTFDLEIENYRKNKRLADPFNPENYIVEAGWSWDGGERESIRFEENHRESIMDKEFNSLNADDLIVGFNIKFDNLWVWGQESFQNALKRGVTIYCGQYAEYLLGGMTQSVQMTSMNDIAEKYGGGCKLDAVKEMWEDGYLTSQIPADMLHDYLVGDGEELIGDVQNTWLIYQGQVQRMLKSFPTEFRTMFKHRMDGLLATTEMEYNGMYVDACRGAELQKEVSDGLDQATEELAQFIPTMPSSIKFGETEATFDMEFNWNSPVHKSCLMFGGTAKYEKWAAYIPAEYTQREEEWPKFNDLPVDPYECKLAGSVYVREVTVESHNTVVRGSKIYEIQDTFKGGQKKGLPKTKKVKVDDYDKPKGKITDFYFKFKGYTEPKKKWKGANTDAYDEPLYGTGADVIEDLSKRGIPFTDALARRTSLSKDLGTYYWAIDKKGVKKGMLTLVNNKGLIHHALHHVKTVTSRMSSSNPNMQNIPRKGTSQIKQVFTSRFPNGKMAEIDYSQLEVVIQGILSGDKQLVKDLQDGIDFHCKRLAAKIGMDYDDVWRMHHVEKDPDIGIQRTGAKSFSFQRAYGAGVAAVVESTGMSKEDVESLIEAEETLYPGVSKFDRNLERILLRNSSRTDRKLFLDGVAFTQNETYWDSPTGTRYVWEQGITPEFMHKSGKYTGYSPTERKNYPVQGMGGEIMQTMLGKLFRYFLKNDRFDGEVLLVNSVHDCVVLDGHGERFEEIVRDVTKLLESVPEVFNEAFPDTLKITVPFPVEAEVGADLHDMEVIH